MTSGAYGAQQQRRTALLTAYMCLLQFCGRVTAAASDNVKHLVLDLICDVEGDIKFNTNCCLEWFYFDHRHFFINRLRRCADTEGKSAKYPSKNG